MFLRDLQLVQGLDCNMGEVTMNCMFLLYSLQVHDWTTDPLQHNEKTTSEMEMCMWK